jgi:hypothetical protein
MAAAPSHLPEPKRLNHASPRACLAPSEAFHEFLAGAITIRERRATDRCRRVRFGRIARLRWLFARLPSPFDSRLNDFAVSYQSQIGRNSMLALSAGLSDLAMRKVRTFFLS